jgi:hypothetical protein
MEIFGIVLIAMYLVYIGITTTLLVIDSNKAKQEGRKIKPVYIVLFNISWVIIIVIAIIFILFYVILSIGLRGM